MDCSKSEHMVDRLLCEYNIKSDDEEYKNIRKLCYHIFHEQQLRINDLSTRIDRFRLGMNISEQFIRR